jgi:hypothetical protein
MHALRAAQVLTARCQTIEASQVTAAVTHKPMPLPMAVAPMSVAQTSVKRV